MTTTHVAFIIVPLVVCVVVSQIGWTRSILKHKHLIKLLNDHNNSIGAINDLIADEQAKARNVGANFLAACRIIDIRINGRSLFITCARNDDTFIIETMALMSTDVPLLRQQAGLDT